MILPEQYFDELFTAKGFRPRIDKCSDHLTEVLWHGDYTFYIKWVKEEYKAFKPTGSLGIDQYRKIKRQKEIERAQILVEIINYIRENTAICLLSPHIYIRRFAEKINEIPEFTNLEVLKI